MKPHKRSDRRCNLHAAGGAILRHKYLRIQPYCIQQSSISIIVLFNHHEMLLSAWISCSSNEGEDSSAIELFSR